MADALDALGAPYVVKDDGLAAGKGVVVTEDREPRPWRTRRGAWRPGSQVVVEEFLDGPEVSLFCLTDGEHVVPLAPAQDFKRVGDGDTGPNTGGMGAYSPLDWAPAGLVDDVVARVAQPTVDEMRRRGTPFTGVLYVGLALTSRGPRVIEFNARFGDPETQVVLARLRSPLGQLLRAAAVGGLDRGRAAALERGPRRHGGPRRPGLPGLAAHRRRGRGARRGPAPSVEVMHAGTAFGPDGTVVAAGGRVLSVVALGADLAAGARAGLRRAGHDRARGRAPPHATSRSRPPVARSPCRGPRAG